MKAEKGTTKMLKVTLPKRLEKILVVKNGTPTPTRLKIRVLVGDVRQALHQALEVADRRRREAAALPTRPRPSTRTRTATATARPTRSTPTTTTTCSPTRSRSSLKLSTAARPTRDDDGVEDGYEYQSARDLNDDEHQNPNSTCPYPREAPYPNPLDGDGRRRRPRRRHADADGGVPALEVHDRPGPARTLERLTYSAGEQYSRQRPRRRTGIRQPTLAAAGYDKQADFLAWAGGARLPERHVALPTSAPTWSAPADVVRTAHRLRHPRHGPQRWRVDRRAVLLRLHSGHDGYARRRRARRGRRRPDQLGRDPRLHEPRASWDAAVPARPRRRTTC